MSLVKRGNPSVRAARVQVSIGGRSLPPMEMSGIEYTQHEDGTMGAATLQAEVPERVLTRALHFEHTSQLSGVVDAAPFVDFIEAVEESYAMEDAAAAAVRDASAVVFRGDHGRFSAERVAGDALWNVSERRVGNRKHVLRYQAERAAAILIAKGLSTGLLSEDEAKAMALLSFHRDGTPAEGDTPQRTR